jgi:hypothetical protein
MRRLVQVAGFVSRPGRSRHSTRLAPPILASAPAEVKRVGFVRFFDVPAFRIYYRLFVSRTESPLGRSWYVSPTTFVR